MERQHRGRRDLIRRRRYTELRRRRDWTLKQSGSLDSTRTGKTYTAFGTKRASRADVVSAVKRLHPGRAVGPGQAGSQQYRQADDPRERPGSHGSFLAELPLSYQTPRFLHSVGQQFPHAKMCEHDVGSAIHRFIIGAFKPFAFY
jgi:hypothetical protein